MLRVVQTVLCVAAICSLVVCEATESDHCTQSPQDTVHTCATCATTLHISMDLCCTSDKVLQFCQNLPQLDAGALTDNALLPINDGQDQSVWPDSGSQDTKALQYVLNKRNNRYLLGKRPRNNFLGKRSDEVTGQEDMLQGVEKRRRPFLGKRGPRPFLGKREEYAEDEKRARPFLGKRDERLEEGFSTPEEKRARPFLGKRRRPFLGKRSDTQDEAALSDVIKRAKYFLGKKAKYFLGKRGDEMPDLAQVSFNDIASDENVKRQQKYFLGK